MKQISVIIATYNRANWLRTTLERMTLLEQDGLDWELVVADNNSSDNTRAVVDGFCDRLPLWYLFEPRQGKNFAVNTAIEKAEGEILVFTDDDVAPFPTWLKEIKASCDRWPGHYVFGGRVQPEFPPGTPKYVQNSSFSDMVYAVMDLPQCEGPFPTGATPNGPNCWVRRGLFDAGWRYNPRIGPKGQGRISGSELEFFVRLGAAGYHPVYVPSASVFHRVQPHQTTFFYLLKRSWASGRGTIRIYGYRGDCPKWFRVPRYLFRLLLDSAMMACFRFRTLGLQGGS